MEKYNSSTEAGLLSHSSFFRAFFFMIGYIYKITSPTGKIYIGQTNNLERRHSEYEIGNCKNQRYLHNSILKYGWQNHKFEILFQSPTTERHLNLLEIEYIKIYKSNKLRYPEQNGLNLTDGGGGTRGPKSEKHRATISANRKGCDMSHLQTPEARAKRLAANKGRKHSEESKAKMRKPKKKTII